MIASILYKVLRSIDEELHRLSHKINEIVIQLSSKLRLKYLKFLGALEKRYVLEMIENNAEGYLRLEYASTLDLEKELIKRGARILKVNESDPEDIVPWRCALLKYSDKLIVLHWKFIALGLERNEISWTVRHT
jgi:hypothetical protein